MTPQPSPPHPPLEFDSGCSLFGPLCQGRGLIIQSENRKKEMWFWIHVKGVLLHKAALNNNNKDFISLMCMQVGNVLIIIIIIIIDPFLGFAFSVLLRCVSMNLEVAWESLAAKQRLQCTVSARCNFIAWKHTTTTTTRQKREPKWNNT